MHQVRPLLSVLAFCACAALPGWAGQPTLKEGETVPAQVELVTFIPGLDLPRLGDSEGYHRSDEYVYRVERKTRRVVEVILIGDVIIW